MKLNKKIVIIGPFPPPVGGISLFVKNLFYFLNKNFKDKVEIINEFDSQKESNIYALSSKSKIKYILKLVWFFIINKNIDYIYYNGVHGITRFIIVVIGKVIRARVIFHFHGESVIRYYNKNYITKLVSKYTLKKSFLLIAVNSVLISKILEINKFLEIINLPAYISNNNIEISDKMNTFISKLSMKKKYYLSYGTLDRDKGGNYNYGILELIHFFSSNEIYNNNISLIFVLILSKKEHFSEFNAKLKDLFKKNEKNIKLFINHGQDPLKPFFKFVKGYIRWTHEDGLGVSLIEALEYGIEAIATDVCERPSGVILFNNKNYNQLFKIIQSPSNDNLKTNFNYEEKYKEIFINLGFESY